MALLQEKKCIFCNSEDTETIPARIAPFIKERINNLSDLSFNLIHCKKCGSAFYDYRYSEEEVQKIYNGYRNQQYQESRQKYENWYSKEINKLIGDDKKAIKSRNNNLTKILKENVPVDNIKTILDYGGDKGQYIPDIFNNKQKYVYDISNTSVLDGVVSIKDLKTCYELQKEGYDLIICAHVLEHLTNPEETIKTIKSLLKKNGYLYIELPFDSPFYKRPMDNIQYLFNKYFKFKDLVAKYFEMKNQKYALMHEHINFYTICGLNHLLLRNDFKVKYSQIRKIYSVIGMSRVISALYYL